MKTKPEKPVNAPEQEADPAATDVGAVILAAGCSSRMKAFKPLLDVGGVSALERLVTALKDAGICRIVVVTGHDREKLRPVIAALNGAHGAGECVAGGRERAADVGARTNVGAGAAEACGEVSSCRIVEAYHAGYRSGMFSSIQAGLSEGRKAFAQVRGFFLMPVDCPLISSGVILRLLERITDADASREIAEGKTPFAGAAPKGDARFYVPIFEGKKGHPLYIPCAYIAEICAYEGQGGLKAITDRYGDSMVRVPVEEEGCVLDMDTPEGYEEIRAFLAAGCRRKPLAELAAGRRIFLVRHGETRLHAGKMFIGRYDVPLRDGAESDVERMALRLADRAPDVQVIYTSPLKRARQTARILRDVLGGVPRRPVDGEAEPSRETEKERAVHRLEASADRCVRLCMIEELQEIHLGEWDGKSIDRVKEHFPEAYARRGLELFAFKMGNGAENFYDVQYRAVKVMRKILENDASKDIIIVTHNTVIRALENNLKGLKIDDEWVKLEKSDFRVINLCERPDNFVAFSN